MGTLRFVRVAAKHPALDSGDLVPSNVSRCRFIVNNKRRCALFFRVGEHRDYISGSYRWTRRVNEPRFYANATRANVTFLARFCTGRQLAPATLSASNSERALLGTAIRGSSRSIIRTGATSAADFTRYMRLFFSQLRLYEHLGTGGNEITVARSIN